MGAIRWLYWYVRSLALGEILQRVLNRVDRSKAKTQENREDGQGSVGFVECAGASGAFLLVESLYECLK